MFNVIPKLCKALNLLKDFSASYSSCSCGEGFMMIEYIGKRYAVRLVEIKNPEENPFEDLNKVPAIMEGTAPYCPRTNSLVVCDRDCSNCDMPWEE